MICHGNSLKQWEAEMLADDPCIAHNGLDKEDGQDFNGDAPDTTEQSAIVKEITFDEALQTMKSVKRACIGYNDIFELANLLEKHMESRKLLKVLRRTNKQTSIMGFLC